MLNIIKYISIIQFVAILLIPFQSSADWETYPIDGGQSYTGLYPSIKIGPDGIWHISYLNSYENKAIGERSSYIRYVKLEQDKLISDWTPDVMDYDVTTSPGNYISLDLDSQGLPHIAYCDSASASLKYAHFNGTSWDKEALIIGEAGPFVSLALDSMDRPHIACYAESALKYLAYADDGWRAATVDNSSDAGTYCSLALDYSDTPHIAYYDESNGDLKYAMQAGDVWQTATVDSLFNAGQYASLACDSDGTPHIAYYNQGLKVMQYATPDDSAQWRTYFVAGDLLDVIQGFLNQGSGASHCSLALDSLGTPHISYFDGASNRIIYAEPEDDGIWWQKSVPHDDISGPYNCLVLDGNDNPYIAFFYDRTRD